MNDTTSSAVPEKARALPGHSTVGTNDLDAAAAYYDKLLAVFGIGRVLVQPGRAVYYGHRALEFGVLKPFNGETAIAGNGTMIAFEARSRAQVDLAHATALGGASPPSARLRHFLQTRSTTIVRARKGNLQMNLENKAQERQVTRRSFLLSGVAVGVAAVVVPGSGVAANVANAPTSGEDIRPFKVDIPETALADLRRRLDATRWPDSATVKDRSQGVDQQTLRDLVAYWQSAYDWRRAERKLNEFPQFLTKIDGLDIHFIHVRSRHENALPLIMTHG